MKRFADRNITPASLPLSKLRGLPNAVRVTLKVRRVNSCAQLLAVAAAAEARRRLDSQWPIDRKRERADFVIDTSGSFEATGRQVREIWAALSGGATRRQ